MLLGTITPAEAVTLWDRCMDDLYWVNREIEQLSRLDPRLRDELYGPGILAQTIGVRDDMIALMAAIPGDSAGIDPPEEEHHGTPAA